MKIFQLQGEDSGGRSIIIDLTEYEITALINLCWRRGYHKRIGHKIGKLYLETGNSAKQNLTDMGIDIQEVEEGYKEYRQSLIKKQ